VTAGFYERRGLQIETYAQRAALNQALQGDFEFYLELAHRLPGPVLELGCGAGRLLVPFAQAGFEITGLDRSPAMLEIAAERLAEKLDDVRARVTLASGDMSSFDLGRRFATAIIAFRSFQMLTRREDQRRCLEAVHEHLVPGGVLAMDLFDPLLETIMADSAPGNTQDLGHFPHPVSWNLVRVQSVARTYDLVEQVLEELHRFSEVGRDGTVLREEEETLRMRWIYRYEMRYLLELCGFVVEAEYSDYKKSPPAYGKEQVWVARRRA
jgi:SAM-dependent methyltransferase